MNAQHYTPGDVILKTGMLVVLLVVAQERLHLCEVSVISGIFWVHRNLSYEFFSLSDASM